MDSEVEKLQKILGIDKKSKIVFNKTNFSPEKIGVRPVFDRMFTNANFRSEIDILLAFLQDVVDPFVNVCILSESSCDFAHALDGLSHSPFHIKEKS